MAKRLSQETTSEISSASRQLSEGVDMVKNLASLLMKVNRRPFWKVYATAMICSIVGAVIAISAIYYVSPSYSNIILNQKAIYQEIKKLK